MKQVIQNRRTGKLALCEVPAPKVRAGHLLVRTRASLISPGTERMVIDSSRKTLLGKARERPDLVTKVLDKAKRDGFAATFQAVMARLDEPLPLGYSAAGEVVAVGVGLEGKFRVGERVAMAGAGVANHAEVNAVPENLVCSVGDDVSDEDACFGTLGSIALHAVRNSESRLGDVVAVIGCGLVGQLAAQFLRLSGARVVALDYDVGRLALAAELGAELTWNLAEDGFEAAISRLSEGTGCDAVVIAAATQSNEPFETAAVIARDRARIVLVGMTGTAFPYADFMKKELSVVVSRSYGPGRYDDDFENRGVKYPEGWVRWTETKNLAETLRLMSPVLAGRLDVAALVTHRFPIDAAEDAYALVTVSGEPYLGVVLTYPKVAVSIRPHFKSATGRGGGCILGVIGAGNFARSVLLPELKKMPAVYLHTLATQRGASAEHGKQSFGFTNASADPEAVFCNPEINAVLIATRHDSHAELTARALAAGKAVLVEKPLAIDLDGVNAVITARNDQSEAVFFQVGFNRRFALPIERLRRSLAKRDGAKVVLIRVNAGAIDAAHWVHAADEGGGRIVGEVCHFVDLARYLAGSYIVSVQAEGARVTEAACDDVSVALRFADGSIATILYTALGDARAGKEWIEVHAAGATYSIDDFRTLTVSGDAATAPWRGSQDKGFHLALKAFFGAVVNAGPAPIDEAELIETTVATIAILESLRCGARIDL